MTKEAAKAVNPIPTVSRIPQRTPRQIMPKPEPRAFRAFDPMRAWQRHGRPGGSNHQSPYRHGVPRRTCQHHRSSCVARLRGGGFALLRSFWVRPVVEGCEGGQKTGEARRSTVEHRLTFFGSCIGRVAADTLRVEIIHDPARHSRLPGKAKPVPWPIAYVGAKIPRLGHIDPIRPRRQHGRGFYIACMQIFCISGGVKQVF